MGLFKEQHTWYVSQLLQTRACCKLVLVANSYMLVANSCLLQTRACCKLVLVANSCLSIFFFNSVKQNLQL